MTELGFTPEGLAHTIAGRETGANRLDPVLGKLEKLTNEHMNTKISQAGIQKRKEYPPVDKEKRKKQDFVPNWDEMNRIEAEKLELEGVQGYGGNIQGQYETRMQKAKTEVEKAAVQKDFENEFNPIGSKKEIFGYENASGERQYSTPLETVHGIATVENQLYNNFRDDMIKSGEIKDAQNITLEESQKIQEKIDMQLRDLGITLLRGQAILNPFGQILVDKAITDAYNILHPPRK